jgi:hypothetical protein
LPGEVAEGQIPASVFVRLKLCEPMTLPAPLSSHDFNTAPTLSCRLDFIASSSADELS